MGMKKTFLAILSVLCLISINICCNFANSSVSIPLYIKPSTNPPYLAKWTYMVYFVGDMTVQFTDGKHPADTKIMIPAINSMELYGSTPNVNIVVQADDLNVWNHQTRRYYITKDSDINNITSPLADPDTSEKNMGNPQTLINFVNWATDKYPAEHYILIMYGHGAGWEGICHDETSGGIDNPDAYIDINELGSALSSCVHLDVLFLWACTMGEMEEFYQLKGHTDIVLASESNMGYCDDTIKSPLENLTINPNLSPSELTQKFADSYCFSGINNIKTLFGIHTSDSDNLKNTVGGLADAFLSEREMYPVMTFTLFLNALIHSTIKFWVNPKDFRVHELYKLAEFIPDSYLGQLLPSISDAAVGVTSSIDSSSIIKPNPNPMENLHGIAIYSPRFKTIYQKHASDYKNISFSIDTQWDELLDWFYDEWYQNEDQSTCFVAGTRINMADGSYKNIENIKVGDLVKSYDVSTGELVNSKVTKTYYHATEDMTNHYLIINNKICVTPNHLLYVNGMFIPAGLIKIGNHLTASNGSDGMIYSIKQVSKNVPTYSFEIDSIDDPQSITTYTFVVENILVYPLKIVIFNQEDMMKEINH